MPNEFVARNGVIALSSSQITGSLNVSQGITGSLFGTSSWSNNTVSAISSSYPVTLSGSTVYTPINVGGFSSNSSVLIGSSAGSGSTSAAFSNFIGFQAGFQATSANNSNFLGANAGYSSSNAAFSTFIGQNSGYNAPNATYSTFLGRFAGYLSTNASYSNFFGRSAGDTSPEASYSNFFGQNAGRNAASASYSNFLGAESGRNSTNATHSNFLGESTGYGATNANDSNFIGRSAGYTAINAQNSNFLGFRAGNNATQASASNFLGYEAGQSAFYAHNSNFIGTYAGWSAASASYSTILGYRAGYNVQGESFGVKSNNIIIGTNITLENGRQDSINIGGFIFGTGSYSTTVGNPFSGSVGNGRVGINQPLPLYNLDVSGSARFTGEVVLSGSITAGNITGSLSGTASYATNTAAVAGTTNYLAKFTGTGTTVGNSNFYEFSNVGYTTLPFTVYPTTAGGSYIQWKYGSNVDVGVIGSDASISGGTATDFGIYAYGNNNLDLWTNNNRRIRITGAGNVGIGTAAPVNELEIFGSSQPRLAIRTTESILESLELGFQFGTGANSSTNTLGLIRAVPTQVDPNPLIADLAFSTNAGDSNTEKVRITGAGNVGIGTTTPNAKLDVNGNAIITGSLTVTGTITAQTLVVQTVTSSIDFVTGSTRFGSTLSNTHQFTGSVGMTGSLTVNNNVLSVGGTNVGIGTTSPTQKLEVDGNIKLTSGGYLYGDGSSAYLVLTNTNGSKLAYGSSVYFEALAASANIRASSENINIFNNNGRITLSGSGAVGVGTANPIAELHVSGSNTDSLLLVASPGAASALFVSGSGFVGIGTSTPTYPLTIGGTNPAMLLSTSTGQSTLYFTNTSNAIYNLSSDNGLVFYVNSSNQGKITTNGNWGIGTTSPTEKLHISGGNVLIVNSAAANDANTAVLRLQAGSDATLGALYLQTELRPSATGGNRRVEIYAGDNSAYRNITFPYASVGIGTTSPSYKLHVEGSNNTTPFGISVGSNAHYVFTGNSTSGYTTTFNINDTGLYIGHNSSARSLSLQTNSTDRLTILGGGNVGIGTTAPDSNLQVGSVSTSGNRTIKITDANYGLLLSGGNGLANNYIQSLGTTIPLYFLAGNSNDANYIFSSTGNVGIGTTTPARKLDVVGLAQFSGQVNFNATGAQIQLGGQGTGTQTGIYQGTNSDILYIGNWANSTNTVAINASSGNVGIGGTPLDRTTIIQDQNSTTALRVRNSNTGSSAYAMVGINASGNSWAMRMGSTAANSNALNFVSDAFGTPTPQMTILTSGNVGIGTTSPNARLDVSGNAIITGSLTVAPTAGNVELQVTSTGTKIGNVITDLNTITGSLGISGSTVIVGSLAIGTSSLGSTENTLVVGPSPAGGTGEGGQILLQATGGTYTSASMLDNYQNRFRILRGTNASSDAEYFNVNLHNGQITFNKYSGSGAFTGTAAANLAVDSGGNVITVATGGGGGSVTINNNVDNYLITATGTANTLNGEANLQFNGSAFTITGSLTVITGSSVELQVTNTGVNIGNSASDSHNITGSVGINGNLTVNGNLIGAEPVPAGAKLYLFYNY